MKEEKALAMRANAIQFNTELQPVRWSDVRAQIAPQGESVKAPALVDHELTFMRAKAYRSSFEDQDHVYWVVAFDETDERLVNFTLGGAACVEILDAIAKNPPDEPILFVLAFHAQGNFDGYYTLE